MAGAGTTAQAPVASAIPRTLRRVRLGKNTLSRSEAEASTEGVAFRPVSDIAPRPTRQNATDNFAALHQCLPGVLLRRAVETYLITGMKKDLGDFRGSAQTYLNWRTYSRWQSKVRHRSLHRPHDLAQLGCDALKRSVFGASRRSAWITSLPESCCGCLWRPRRRGGRPCRDDHQLSTDTEAIGGREGFHWIVAGIIRSVP